MQPVAVCVSPMSADSAAGARESAEAARSAVIAERKNRGWSRETAARMGGISGEYWGRYEKGLIEADDAHPKVVMAVRMAFDWPADWPTNVPTDVNRRLSVLEQQAEEHRRIRGQGIAAMDALTTQVEALVAQVAKLDARLGGRQAG